MLLAYVQIKLHRGGLGLLKMLSGPLEETSIISKFAVATLTPDTSLSSCSHGIFLKIYPVTLNKLKIFVRYQMSSSTCLPLLSQRKQKQEEV